MASVPKLNDIERSTRLSPGWSDGMHFLPPSKAASDKFVRAWTDLVANASEPNPFFEPAMLNAALRHLAGREQVEVAAFVEAGRLVGLVPIERSQSYYGYLLPHCSVWLHDNAFCSTPLIATGHEAGFWRALFAAIDADPRRSLFLHMPMLPAAGPVAQSMRAVLAAQLRANGVVRSESRAMLLSDRDAMDYLQNVLSIKRRKELRRLHKRLSERGELSFERHSDDTQIGSWIDEFLALERASWKGDENSALASSPDTKAFFTEAMQGMARHGRLERLAFRLDGRPVAMLANLDSAPGVFSFKTTYDADYAKYSPGLLLQLENITVLDRPEIEWADSCAVQGHSMIERLWKQKRVMHSTNIAIGGNMRRAMFNQLIKRETRPRPNL